jgi:hypothetical protein
MDGVINNNIEFRFVGIEIKSKILNELGNSKIDASVTFNIRVESKVAQDQGIVIMNVIVKIYDAKDSQIFAEFNIDCIFHIIDFEKHIKLNEQSLFVIPPNLEAIFKPVSISTVRGVIYSELRGTYLNTSIMPVVFMDQMVHESIK